VFCKVAVPGGLLEALKWAGRPPFLGLSPDVEFFAFAASQLNFKDPIYLLRLENCEKYVCNGMVYGLSSVMSHGWHPSAKELAEAQVFLLERKGAWAERRLGFLAALTQHPTGSCQQIAKTAGTRRQVIVRFLEKWEE
jgi:hypothetical protein